MTAPARTYTAAQVAEWARESEKLYPGESLADIAGHEFRGIDAWAAANGIGIAAVEQAVATAPDAGGIDWARVPKGYNALTMDMSGIAAAWRKASDTRNNRGPNMWSHAKDFGPKRFVLVPALDHYHDGDWRDSLRRRPT